MTSRQMTWDEVVAALTVAKADAERWKKAFEDHTGNVSDWLMDVCAEFGIPSDTPIGGIMPTLTSTIAALTEQACIMREALDAIANQSCGDYLVKVGKWDARFVNFSAGHYQARVSTEVALHALSLIAPSDTTKEPKS